MYFSPAELRSLIAAAPVEIVDVCPRIGVTKEGERFPRGHELHARFEGANVLVQIDRLQTDPLCQVHWSLDSELPPVVLTLQRRRAGVQGRGIATGTRGFDAAFKLEAEPSDMASRVFDKAFAERLVSPSSVWTLDDAIAIGREERGRLGFGTFLRVPPRPDAVAESFAITREIRARILATRQPQN